MSVRRTALLIVDAQRSFEQRACWKPAAASMFLERLQALADGARARAIPVVQIFHVEDTGVFSLSSGYVGPLANVSVLPDVVIHKHRHSAFVGSRLPAWLIEHGIQRLIISGIRTEQCCETTARHAADSGYEVDFVTDATLTFPMVDRNGHSWSVEQIRARTQLVLDGRFARVVTVGQALAAAEDLVRQ